MNLRMEELGRTVAEQQDEDLSRLPSVPEPQWPERREQRSYRRVFWAALVVGTAMVGVILLSGIHPTEQAFNIDGRAGAVGAWLERQPGQPGVLAFSDGTRIELGSDAGARVIDLDRRRARVSLERGAAHFQVEPDGGLKWQVVAGPFEVWVTGTDFSLAWQPAAQQLRLHLKSGSVRVRGCGISGERALAPGEPIHFDCLPHAGRGAGASQDAEPIGPTADADPGSARGAPDPPQRISSDKREHSSAEEWRDLARGGKYHQAMARLEAEGFAAQCSDADAKTLSTIATVARLAGRTPRAVEAYTLMRRRFAGTKEATLAAFALGRIEFEQRSNSAAAAKWFESYLQEAPGGRLASEAQGRLIEAYHRMGNAAAARQEARRYLERYPQGPHSEIARQLVVNQDESP